MSIRNKDFISLYGVKEEIFSMIFKKASTLKKRHLQGKTIKSLTGKNVVNAFFEPSTRTRNSFEVAEKNLGANVTNFNSTISSIAKGECLSDTVRTLEAVGMHCIVVRHPSVGAAQLIADSVDIPVINAGDGNHEHPTQTLLDLFTIYEHKGTLKDQRLVLVGDIAHSRSVRATVFAMRILGGTVVLSGPPSLVPDYYKQFGAEICYDLDEALDGATAVKTGRIQRERFKSFYLQVDEYQKNYRLDKKRMAKYEDKILIMHGAPIHRGEEITSEVAEGPNSVIFEMMQNGTFIRMALLDLIIGDGTYEKNY